MDGFAYGTRGMQHGDVFRIAPTLHAERATDVFGEKAQFFRLDVHGAGDLPTDAGDALRTNAQRKLLHSGIVTRGRRARLKRGYDQPLVDEFDAHYMSRLLEGALKRSLLFAFRIGRSRPVEADIARRFGPELRGALLYRIACVGDRRQLLIVDDDLVGGVLRGGGRFGDDHCHWFTHMHHPGFGKRWTMR